MTKTTISSELDELVEKVDCSLKIDYAEGHGVLVSADGREVYVDYDEIEEFGFSSVLLDGLLDLREKIDDGLVDKKQGEAT